MNKAINGGFSEKMPFKKILLLLFVLTLSGPAFLNSMAPSKQSRRRAEKECTICMELKAKSNFFRLSCRHEFCFDCLLQIIMINLQENYLAIRCPNRVCQTIIINQDLEALLKEKKELLTLLSALQFKEWLFSQSSVKHCPTPNCPYSFLNDEGIKEKVSCPHCQKSYCSYCLVNHDKKRDCMQVKARLKKEEELSKEWKNFHTIDCPQCKSPIQKIYGCKSIRCRSCSHEFCYRCLGPYYHRKHECVPHPLYLKIIEPSLEEKEKEKELSRKIKKKEKKKRTREAGINPQAFIDAFKVGYTVQGKCVAVAEILLSGSPSAELLGSLRSMMKASGARNLRIVGNKLLFETSDIKSALQGKVFEFNQKVWNLKEKVVPSKNCDSKEEIKGKKFVDSVAGIEPKKKVESSKQPSVPPKEMVIEMQRECEVSEVEKVEKAAPSLNYEQAQVLLRRIRESRRVRVNTLN